MSRFLLSAFVALGMAFAMPLPAKEYSDAAALRGVKEAKAVFLVDIGQPQKAALYLDLIGRSTHARLIRQKVEPDFVIVFIGPTVQFITTRPKEDIVLQFEEALKSIRQSIQRLKELGVRMEVCSVATEVFGVQNDTLLPGLHVVGDGFVSVIGWQSQGYHLVPVY